MYINYYILIYFKLFIILNVRLILLKIIFFIYNSKLYILIIQRELGNKP